MPTTTKSGFDCLGTATRKSFPYGGPFQPVCSGGCGTDWANIRPAASLHLKTQRASRCKSCSTIGHDRSYSRTAVPESRLKARGNRSGLAVDIP